jgi:hypothetical protein
MKKGTEVWMIRSWDNKGAFYAQRLTITSLGKQQGTATRNVNGENLKVRLYAPYDDLYPVNDVADVGNLGMELAQKWLDEKVAFHQVHRVQWCMDQEAAGLPCAYRLDDMIAEVARFQSYKPSFFIDNA